MARAPKNAGFTLVELMVGLTAGGILLGSVWILSASSSQFFHRESRIASTQSALRVAAEQIRRDVARAGFLGTPNSNTLAQACGPVASTPVQAVNIEQGEETGINVVRNDTLQLTGNYATSERYLLDGGDMALTVLRFDLTDDAFRRSFYNLAGDTFSQDAFKAAFAENQMVRVEVFSPRRQIYFRHLVGEASTTANSAEITLSQALPGPPCVDASNLTNAFISPLVTIHYGLLEDAAIDAAGLGNLTRDGSAGIAMDSALVRREVDTTDDSFVAGGERVVLEYAVEFRLTALDCATLPATACNLAELSPVDPEDLAVNPQRIQGLRFHLAVRTPEADTGFDPAGSLARDGLDEPLRVWMGQIGGVAANARVRTSTFDVALVNNL